VDLPIDSKAPILAKASFDIAPPRPDNIFAPSKPVLSYVWSA
jgi:hypothetical protein